MTKSEIERLTVIETKFETIIVPMAQKVDTIYENFVDINRKVNEHHKMYNSLKKADCPNLKVMPDIRKSDGNGGYVERRTKKGLWQQYKELPLPKRLSILVIGLPFFGGYWNWLLETLEKIINWLQTLS
jgi:hypothetical protein